MTKEEIKSLRKQLGLTQEQMARKIGVTVAAYYHWEAGKSKPHSVFLDILERLRK